MRTHEQTRLVVRYDVEANEIDINTLLYSLLYFTEVTQAINDVVSRSTDSPHKLDIKVKAFEPGSFLVDIDVETATTMIKTLFGATGVSYLANLKGTWDGAFSLFRLAKGRLLTPATKSDGKVVIHGNNNEVVVADTLHYHAYQDPRVQVGLGHMFRTLEQNPSVKGLSIYDEDNTVRQEVDKAEFPLLARTSPVDEEDTQTEIVDEALLVVASLDFDKPNKWSFIYNGIRIPAKITDRHYIDQLDNERFGRGDRLIARLLIHQVFDRSLGVYQNKSYEIQKVIRHEMRPEQLNLNMDGHAE